MQIIDKPSLKQYTTLGIGGVAQKEYLLEKIEDVEKLVKLLEEDKLPHLLLGGGSNMLIADGELDFVLVRDYIDAKKTVEIIKEDNDFAWLKVSSGTYLPIFTQFCAKNGFSGLEGLVGIPGRMGGALAMNAGAFSCEISNVFDSATIFTKEKGISTYKKEDVNFAYRHFSLRHENDYQINLDMTFKMQKKSPLLIQEQIKENFDKKKNSQPLREKTAGCAFKNPENTAAGKLIDEVGLKGYRLNDMGFSPIHANFLTNFSNGTFEDALSLIELAKQRVYESTGIQLQTEIKIIHSNLL